ncbi:NUDIX hydrolase [Liquorilactobacillus mali]|uniref:ADP-ribose pyrophosphatase n=1 Tax=Liquorilactobacillus mali KCTC 3596 = DSM 20444 TaxID=1046596 RepID=J0KXL5_9LACO|nr:NUDIX hydrolase [Liquorilactobacillus mali]EJE98345.1 ADP-ribose pyrophosphatase [Liquorilactobacillus mali KCTC 3596 = DSM 20444]KRN10700.1 ADP-ribose pyrophosphatase [Liquorilactobacillus mali KCTC 3596 = DSM 20444]MDC7951962.1 NUDIX hydrolase [Liquorilactobacillus mali]MDV7757176.1 NUDIX domain-containing protein [Liquorilactobacillus mali]QFQ74943.1 NUDIX hydrolase [Liquorilactobacillus mali]
MKYEEEVISSKEVYRGKIIRVEEEQVKLPNGEKAKREIVRHHGAVAIICVTAENKMIFVKQWREPMQRVTLEIPAGKIEVNETDPKRTAIRELNEEVRLHPESLELIADFYTSPGFADERMLMYFAHNLQPVSEELPQDADEFLNTVELTLEEAKEKIKSGLICDSKTIMAVWKWELLELRRS